MDANANTTGRQYASTGAQIYEPEQRAGVPSAMDYLHKNVEEGLALACKLEDALGRVLKGSYPTGEKTGNSPEVKRDLSPLTDEIETVSGKADALNSRLRYILARLDV